MYSLIDVDGDEIKKSKEVTKNVVNDIRQKEYNNVSLNKKLISHKIKEIQSKLHRLGTYDVCKISLSCFDNKRYILNGINSLAYFHKVIRSE